MSGCQNDLHHWDLPYAHVFCHPSRDVSQIDSGATNYRYSDLNKSPKTLALIDSAFIQETGPLIPDIDN